MPNFSNNIEIDKNSVCYGNEVLKISNISRTWIFKFENKAKKNYEIERMNYQTNKRDYEKLEKYKRSRKVKEYSIACAITGLFSVYLLSITIFGVFALAISVILRFYRI